MQEMEYKYILDNNQYTNLISKVSSEIGMMNCKLQVNYYYDTPNLLLNKNNITLRVRQIESDLSLEMKTEISENGLLKIHEELTHAIYNLPMNLDLKKFNWTKYIPHDEEILFKGCLITERRTSKPCEGIKLDIDKNLYLGKIDYELEVEFEEGLDEKALDLLKYYIGDIKKKSCISKKSRFFEELKRLNENI